MITEPRRQELLALVANWEAVAKRKFIDAERMSAENGSALEHAAVCYANCAFDLANFLEAHQ